MRRPIHLRLPAALLRLPPALLLPAALFLWACASPTKQEEMKPKKATITLEDGETLVGSILSQNEEAVGFTNEKGIYRRIPAKEVLFVTLAAPEPLPAPTPAVTVKPLPGLLEKFEAPASGVLAIPAGAIVSINPVQPIEIDTAFPHEALTGEITSDIAAKPAVIPSGATANLEVLQIPARDTSTIVFGLAGVNVNGHLYKPPGGASVRLGAAPSEGGPYLRIPNGTVLSWKLTQPLVLKEVK